MYLHLGDGFTVGSFLCSRRWMMAETSPGTMSRAEKVSFNWGALPRQDGK